MDGLDSPRYFRRDIVYPARYIRVVGTDPRKTLMMYTARKTPPMAKPAISAMINFFFLSACGLINYFSVFL